MDLFKGFLGLLYYYIFLWNIFDFIQRISENSFHFQKDSWGYLKDLFNFEEFLKNSFNDNLEGPGINGLMD